MKKLSSLIIVILFISPFVAAQTVNFITDSVAPGEIFQAEIITTSKLLPADVRLLNPYGYPTTFGLNFIVLDENYYFIYTTIQENSLAGEYTLRIKGEEFKFNVIDPKNEYTSFSPVYIIHEEGEKYLKIKIENYGFEEKEYRLSSSYDAITPSVESLIVPARSSKSFFIHINPEKIKKSMITSLSIDNYQIPIYLVKDVFPTQVFSQETTISKDALVFYIIKDSKETQINYINNILTENKTLEGELIIKNNLETPLTNLSIFLIGNLEKIVKIDKSKIETLEPGEKLVLGLVVNEDKKLEENVYEGALVIGNIEFPMHFDVEESITEEKVKEPLVVEEKTEEIPKVEAEPEGKSYKRFLGYLVLILLAGVLYYYYFGKKQHKKEIKFTEYLKKLKG